MPVVPDVKVRFDASVGYDWGIVLFSAVPGTRSALLEVVKLEKL